METKPETNTALGRWTHGVLYPLIALCVSGGAALAGTADAGHAKTTYTVIHLSAHAFAYDKTINARGQVAFNEVESSGVNRARFYDGKHVRDIGTLGGPGTVAWAVNDLGQVTGQSDVNADRSISHAFRWSQATGIVDLSRSGQGFSVGFDINNKGQVAGDAVFNPANRVIHGFFWTPQAGMQDIGALGPNRRSEVSALNDAGTVSGSAETASSTGFDFIAIRWTRAEGIRGIGAPVGSSGFDINAAGHIVGQSPFPEDNARAYLWTQHRGLLDLGSGSNPHSTATALNDHDVVIGRTFSNEFGPFTSFVWTRAMGLLEFKSQTEGFINSANAVNNRGQVVGSIDGYAFMWTRAEGLVDLNTRIPGAPAGLKLIYAYAISDNGSIVVDSNIGLVLLVPRCGCSRIAPTVGAVTLNGAARAGAQLSFAAAFKDIDATDTHKASWSWGDGSQEVGIVSERSGVGSVSGQHVYAAPGIYTAALIVTDSSGQSTTVQRKITVSGAGAYIAGEGWFVSPPGASRMAARQGGIARFAVLSPAANGVAVAQGKASGIEFSAAGINFRSGQIDAQSMRGGSVQYSGRGSVNGSGGFYFTLSGVTGTSNGRIRVRIWHYAPDTKAEVVDYDNQPGSSASGTDPGGTLVGEGAMTIQAD